MTKINVDRCRRIIAKETGRSVSDVPDLWVARALANGGVVRLIDAIDGGFDVTVEDGFDRYVLLFRASSGVDLKCRAKR